MFLNYHNKSLHSPELKYTFFKDYGFLLLLFFGVIVLIVEGILIFENYTFY